MRTQSENSKLLVARENAKEQVAIVSSFASDWFERMARVSWTNHRAELGKNQANPGLLSKLNRRLFYSKLRYQLKRTNIRELSALL